MANSRSPGFNSKSFFRFPVFLVISLVIHITLFTYGIYSYWNELSKFFLAKSTPHILVDLTDPRDDLFDPDKKVISRFNYAGKGKLSPKNGQHLPGDFNPITDPESSSLKKSQSRSSAEKSGKKKSVALLSEGGESLSKKNGERPLNLQSLPAKKLESDSEVKKKLAIDTEDSLDNQFWFDESEFLQVSVRSHPNAEFSLELAHLLKKRFSTYVLGGGALNFYHVKRDQATALATINSAGEIAFERMVEFSSKQPYMNYLVSRVVDHPGVVKQLPPELQDKGGKRLYFLFNIRFTGEPLRKWWMGFEFLPENSGNR